MKRYRHALALLTAMALAGPARAAELSVWHAYRAEEKAAFEKVAKLFEASKPGTTVTLLAVPYDAFADKITAAVPRGKGPDVFIFAQDKLGGWIEAGNTVEPLDFFLDAAVKARFIPATLEAMTYRGTIYGLPFNFKEITLIYNKKLVSTPPRTDAELVALAKKLTDKAAGRFGLAYSYGDYWYHAALQNTFGGRVFDGGAPVLNNPENVKAALFLQKWIKEGILPAEPSTALVTSLFNEGKAAMVFSGSWFLGEIAKGVEYGLAPLPSIGEAGGKPMRPWMTVEGLYVAAPSKNKDLAYEFLKFVTDVKATTIMAVEGRQTPSNKQTYEDPKVGKDPVLAAFRAQAETAVPTPNAPEMTMVWSPATTAMNTIIRGTSPQAAFDKAQAQVQKDVAGLRKRP